MKAKLQATQSVATIGLIAIAIAIALPLAGCGGDDKPTDDGLCHCPEGTTHEPDEKCCEGKDCTCEQEPTEEQPVLTPYDLYLKDVKITVHYKKKASEEKPEHLSKIDDVVTAFENSVNSGGLEATAVFNNLKSRDGDYSIKVIYGGTLFEGFVAFDGQTLEVHDSWLSADETTLTSPVLRNAFKEMLLKPIPDENGVPYYGTLPNTTIKIYKGDDSVTDEQMTTAIAVVIAGYNGVTDTAWKAEINRKLTKIEIISDKNYTWDGNILGLKYGFEADSIRGVFEMIGSDDLPLTTED